MDLYRLLELPSRTNFVWALLCFVTIQQPFVSSAQEIEAPTLGKSQSDATPFSIFQAYVNGELPVKEAIVYRRISQHDKITNQEWWRFGWQVNSWYVQRLEPDQSQSGDLVPLKGGVVLGKSYDHLWVVGDDFIHVAKEGWVLGSVLDRAGRFPRSLLFSALSLGLPRRSDVISLDESPIHWEDSEFETVRNANRSGQGPPSLVRTKGQVVLGSGGLPEAAHYAEAGPMLGGTVTYRYVADGGMVAIPRSCFSSIP